MLKLPLIFLTLLIINNCYALQIKKVIDNETTIAKVSSIDVTRIFVVGDRIKSVRGVKGAYQRENDEKNGEIYIQPSPLYQDRAFTILINTEQGRHFTLLLTPTSSPSETLMLVPRGVGRERAVRFETAQPYEMTINHLVRAMKNGDVPTGYAIYAVDPKRSYQIGNKLSLKLKAVYEGFNLKGEVYELKNLTRNSFQVNERQFYKKGTRAISLDTIHLQPYANINLYRVIDHE